MANDVAETRPRIDFYDIDKNQLFVREMEVTSLAERANYAEAVVYALTGQFPQPDVLDAALQTAVAEAMTLLEPALVHCRPRSGTLETQDVIEAIAEGIIALRRVKTGRTAPENPFPSLFEGPRWEAYMLFHQAVLIAAMTVGAGRDAVERMRQEGVHPSNFARHMSNLFTGAPKAELEASDPRDKMLTCLIGGFGVVAPTSALARFSAGTRPPMEWALIASAMGCGPAHIGACSIGMRVLQLALSGEGDPAVIYCRTRPYPGFGHPIAPRDPRTAYLFSNFVNSLPQQALALAKTIKERDDLSPNIDFAAAGVFLDWGVSPSLGSALFWISRLPIVLAHICSMLQDPPFGKKSAEVREQYGDMIKFWI